MKLFNKLCPVGGFGSPKPLKIRTGNGNSWQGRENERIKLFNSLFMRGDLPGGGGVQKRFDIPSYLKENERVLVNKLMEDQNIRDLGWDDRKMADFVASIFDVQKNIDNNFSDFGRIKLSLVKEYNKGIEHEGIDTITISIYQSPEKAQASSRQVAHIAAKRIFNDIMENDEFTWPPDMCYEAALLVRGALVDVGINSSLEKIAQNMAEAGQQYFSEMYIYALATIITPESRKYPMEAIRKEADGFMKVTREFVNRTELTREDGDQMTRIMARLSFFMTVEEKFGDPGRSLKIYDDFCRDILPQMSENMSIGLIFLGLADPRPVWLAPMNNAHKRSFMIMLNHYRMIMSTIYDKLHPIV